MNYSRVAVLVLLLSAALLYGLSLYFPVATLDRTCPSSIELPASASPVAGMGNPPIGKTNTDPGIFYLFGVFSLLMGSFGAIGWIANPLAFYATFLLLKRRKPKVAVKSSLLAASFAAVSLHVTNWLVLYGDEGGVCRSSAVAAHLGYWLWLASICMVLLAAMLASIARFSRDA